MRLTTSIKTILILALLVPCSNNSWAQTEARDNRTLNLSLYSEILDETREVLVRLPQGYLDNPDARYPVFFVTDADWNFDLVASTLDFHTRWGRIPAFITIGIVNVNRNRDFVPKEDPGYPFTGSGDRFLDHLNDELLPIIDASYRTSGRRILFGHSFGGVVTINQMLRDASVFDAHIAVGTSTWVAERVLFERTRTRLESNPSLDTFLYLSVGEGDGGATVPDGALYAELLTDLAPEGLEWSHTVFPSENHFTNVPISLHDAIRVLFPFYQQAEHMMQSVEQAGPAGVAEWFSDQQGKLGWRFVPQSMELGLAAVQLFVSGQQQAATAVFDELELRHPYRPETVAYRAIAYARADQPAAAIETIDRALEIGERVNHPESRMVSFRNFRQAMLDRL